MRRALCNILMQGRAELMAEPYNYSWREVSESIAKINKPGYKLDSKDIILGFAVMGVRVIEASNFISSEAFYGKQ